MQKMWPLSPDRGRTPRCIKRNKTCSKVLSDVGKRQGKGASFQDWRERGAVVMGDSPVLCPVLTAAHEWVRQHPVTSKEQQDQGKTRKQGALDWLGLDKVSQIRRTWMTNPPPPVTVAFVRYYGPDCGEGGSSVHPLKMGGNSRKLPDLEG